MTIEDAKQALQDMESHLKSGFSYSEQRTIEELYKRVCGRRVAHTGCQDCYRDAYILITLKLRNMTTLPQESEYKLKAGIVLRRFGSAELFTLDMRAADAEAWLREHPEQITKFQRFPADWQTRVFGAQDAQTGADVQTPAPATKTAATGVKTRTRRRTTRKK